MADSTIDLYTHATPNGFKVSIMLEEVGLPYRIHLVDLVKNEQFKPEFLALNPNNKVPVIVDPNGPGGKPLTLFESGAILFYLARKAESPLLPTELGAQAIVMQWVMFQMANIGPMLGQLGHFSVFATEKVPYGIERYTKEAKRVLGVLDKRLAAVKYIAGAHYSVADIITLPWINTALRLPPIADFSLWPNITCWREEMLQRPAVQRGLAPPKQD